MATLFLATQGGIMQNVWSQCAVATLCVAIRNIGRAFVCRQARFVPAVYEHLEENTAREITCFINSLEAEKRHELLSRGGMADPALVRMKARWFCNDLVLVVRDRNNGNCIAGMAFTGWDRHRTNGDVSVAVADGYRGGLGRWLILSACALLVTRRVKRASAVIESRNRHSLQAFRACGFERGPDADPFGQQEWFRAL
jgi:L-amino acid N-acyltransferase YncA